MKKISVLDLPLLTLVSGGVFAWTGPKYIPHPPKPQPKPEPKK